MSEVANTVSSIQPILKDAYAGPAKTHKRPGKEPRFKKLKEKLSK